MTNQLPFESNDSLRPVTVQTTISATTAVIQDRREVLILSPHFPPSMVAGVHRARHLAKHLPSFGWTPVVVCVGEQHYSERLDPDLAALVPAATSIVKVGAMPAQLARHIGVGDISLRAWANLRRALFSVIASRSIGAVLITGSPFYSMVLAPEIKRRFGVPIVLDFQDPWVSAWGASRSWFSRAGLAHSLAVLLEPRAVRSADFVTSVSEIQNAEMAARYPWLDHARMAAIPIGGDPDDFIALSNSRQIDSANYLDPRFINISYVGTFLPRAEPLVRVLFRAVSSLRAAEPSVANRIRLNFIGSSNNQDDSKTLHVLPLAELEGVGELVREIPQRVSYLHALSILTRSEGLILIGSDEPHYTASKIYPTLMSGRPYVSLFHRESSAHQILRAAGGGRSFAFETPDELTALVLPLANALRTLATSPDELGRADPAIYAPYEARSIAGRFADVLNLITEQTCH